MLLVFCFLLISWLSGLFILGVCGVNILPPKQLELICPLLHNFVFLPYFPVLTCIPQLTACAFNFRVLLICLIVGFLLCILEDQSSKEIDIKLSLKTRTILSSLLSIINNRVSGIVRQMVRHVFRVLMWNQNHSLLFDFSKKRIRLILEFNVCA